MTTLDCVKKIILLKNKNVIREIVFIFFIRINKIKGMINIIDDLASPEDLITFEENSDI